MHPVARPSRAATDAEIAEAGPATPTQTRGGLLQVAALAIVTVLAHGAAFVSLGAALGVWIRRRSRAIAASVGLVLFVTVGWPIVYLNIFGDPGYPRWGLTLASVLPAFSGLLFHRDRPELIANTSAWVAYWDVILILSAAVISGLAIRTVGRRSRKDPPAEADAGCLGPAGRRRVWERGDLERGEGRIKVGLASPGRRMIRDSSMPRVLTPTHPGLTRFIVL